MDQFDMELRQEREAMAILKDGMCHDCLQATTWCVCWDKEDVEEFWAVQQDGLDFQNDRGRYATKEEM